MEETHSCTGHWTLEEVNSKSPETFVSSFYMTISLLPKTDKRKQKTLTFKSLHLIFRPFSKLHRLQSQQGKNALLFLSRVTSTLGNFVPGLGIGVGGSVSGNGRCTFHHLFKVDIFTFANVIPDTFIYF